MKRFLSKKSILIVSILIMVSVVITYFMRSSFAVPLENDARVEEYSELIYYLNISYDGVDIDGVESSDTATSNVIGDVINVTDKIPDGLKFIGFVTTEDGSIGSVKRSDNTLCHGHVVDDNRDAPADDGVWNDEHTEFNYHGLHYDERTRTITFDIKRLQAGCILTVGVKTMTQDVDDYDTPEIETRRDFYNFFVAKEKNYVVNSNTVHAFIGNENEPLHDVDYVYIGDVPENAPNAPLTTKYAKNAPVGVAPTVDVPGYTFSGWETNDVNVDNDSFVMPNNNVTLRGSFEEMPKYQVKYQIVGDKPDSYVTPSTKEYAKDMIVDVDSLVIGSEINGFRFLGWETTDVTITEDNNFTMPEGNVTITGRFEEIKYKVTYAFYDTVTPPNSESLLPEVKYYKPGVKVTHPTITNPSGYKFLGWYKEDNFVMPNEDITIYGEWMIQNGTFEPNSKKEIIDKKDAYSVGYVINYQITVTNNADFEIRDVVIKEDNDNASFVENDHYELQTDHLAKIARIASGESVTLYSKYTVMEEDVDKVINKVMIVGARADNNYYIVDKEISDSTEFNVNSKVIVHHYIENTETKVHEDEVKYYKFGSMYATSPLSTSELDGEYRNKYHSNIMLDLNGMGVVDKNVIEVTYYYTINKYNINVSVIGGVGTITGEEEIVHGNDSKENNITITPAEGYEIAKILVDGVEIDIPNKAKFTLENFKNVDNNHNIEVEFREVEARTPITGKEVSYIVAVTLLLGFAAITFITYRKSLKR
jgi:hypothetical protein